MEAAEFPAWRELEVREYAGDMARNSGREPDQLLPQSEREFTDLLPAGLDTEGHRILIAEEPESGARIGWLWIGRRESDAGPVAWIYDILVEEAFRRQGYGRALMALAEEQALDMGLHRIELNVFGDNAVAQGLYESSGYRETARQMAKDL